MVIYKIWEKIRIKTKTKLSRMIVNNKLNLVLKNRLKNNKKSKLSALIVMRKKNKFKTIMSHKKSQKKLPMNEWKITIKKLCKFINLSSINSNKMKQGFMKFQKVKK